MSGALLMLDLDDFKQINDGHGHRAGDQVLTAVAAVLRNRLRASDIVARFGGDEFAVLMPVGGAPEAEELADMLAGAVHRDVPTPPARSPPAWASPSSRSRPRPTRSSPGRRRDVRRQADGTPGDPASAVGVEHGAAARRARSLRACGSSSSSRTRVSPRGGPPRTSFATARVGGRRGRYGSGARRRRVAQGGARRQARRAGAARGARAEQAGGVVSTARDTHGRTTVVQLVRSPRRLYPVGRLDADTTGLILLTNDGELAERLTHSALRGQEGLQGEGGSRAASRRVR